MVMRALSVSTSLASFEAELEGAIIQHTVAVDYYLETQAPKWSANYADEHATPQQLHSVFAGDMGARFWQAFTLRGDISTLDEGAYAHVPCSSNNAAHDAFTASQLLRKSSKRRARLCPLPAESRLEQYLQQDVQRYMNMREELDTDASESHAAVLSISVDQRHARTSSTGSFVRLPEFEPALDAADDGTASPLAPVIAAAAAMAAVNDICSDGDDLVMPFEAASVAASTVNAARLSSDNSITAGMAATYTAAAAPQITAGQGQDHFAGSSQQAAADTLAGSQALVSSINGSPEASTAAVPFAMEDDAAIAAQKVAARAKLAELQGETSSAAEATVPAGKVGSKLDAEQSSTYQPGGVHSSCVPKRPGALGSMLRARSGADVFNTGISKADGVVLTTHAAQVEASRFLNMILAGLMLCMVLLPALWGAQGWTGAGTSALQTWIGGKLHAYASHICLPAAAALLLYVLKIVTTMRSPLLHFPDSELEQQYVTWSNCGKLFVDSMFQVMFFVICGCLWLRAKQDVGWSGEQQVFANTQTVLAVISMTGSGLPAVILLVLRSAKYGQWRESLIAGSRVCSIIALLVVQLIRGASSVHMQLSMPFIALTQLVGIACMQVRLATFVPVQALHLLVVLLTTGAHQPVLHFVQLFGVGLCLPCLLLHSMETYSRKAFVANLANTGGKKKVL